jgi:hypothetical protein
MPILARILKDRGVVTEKQLEEAIQHQVLFGGRLGTSLHELGLVSEDALQDALARAFGLPAAPVDYAQVQPAAVALVSRALAFKHKVCPYRVRGRTLFLLMVDPSDHTTIAKLGFSLGYIVKPIVVPEFRMIRLLNEHYAVDERWRLTDTHMRSDHGAQPLADEEAAERLDAAETRDEVVEALLGVCLRSFRRVLFFIVREPWIHCWSGAGEGVDAALVQSLRLPLDQPSVLQTVARDKAPFVGRFGPEDQNQQLIKTLGKRPGTNAAVLPVAVRGRVVNLVYCDAGPAGNVKANLGGLMLLVERASRAYLRIIRRRVEEARQPGGRSAAGATKKETRPS